MQLFLHCFLILILIEFAYTERKTPRTKSTAHHSVNHLKGRSLCEKYSASRKVGRNEKEKLKMFNFIILPTQYEKTKTIDSMANGEKSVSEEIKRSALDDDQIETEQLDKLVQEMGQLLILDQTQQDVDSSSQYEREADSQMNRNKRGIKPREGPKNLQSIENSLKDQINPIYNLESEFEHARIKRHRY